MEEYVNIIIDKVVNLFFFIMKGIILIVYIYNVYEIMLYIYM